MIKNKVFSFNSQLYKITGVEKVLMDIHAAIKDNYDAKIVGTISFENVCKEHGIERNEYVKLWNPLLFYHSIVIVHERKYLLLFWLLNHLLFQKIKIVYIHHSMLSGYKYITIMPKHIVCISDRGKENLISYFKVPESHITKIHNCVKDINPAPHRFRKTDIIKILLPARINDVKQQIEIVRHLRGKLSKNICIHFAGIGPQCEVLKKIVEGDSQFLYLGFRNDIQLLLHEYDYMLLYSKHEGLSISLIEAAMTGTPVVCNDVGGNTEIVHDGENGFVVNSWDELIACLNNLEQISEEGYLHMSISGRTLYEEKFTYDRFRVNYLNLLQTL